MLLREPLERVNMFGYVSELPILAPVFVLGASAGICLGRLVLLLTLCARSVSPRCIYARQGSYHFYLIDSKLLKFASGGSK